MEHFAESHTGYATSYTYDGNGNRKTRVVNGAAKTYSYDLGDKLTGIAYSGGGSRSFTYDLVGRILTDSLNSRSFSWTADSRLDSLTATTGNETYTYSAFGTRAKVGTRTFLRAGVGVTASVLDDGNAKYTPGVSEVRSGTTTYSHSGLKHMGAQSGSGGSVAATNTYDAFGGVSASSGSWQGPFGAAGVFGYQTETSALHLLGHRYYEATLGRFLTRDPIGDGSNWYAYCENDPIGNADPTGLVLIRLRFRPVMEGGGIGYHAFIEVIDNVPGSRTYGKSHVFSGGPDRPWPRHTNLESKSGPSGPGQYDFGHGSEKPPITLVNDDSPFQPWVDEFERIELELWPVPYNPIKDNSNSYVRELLDRIGLLDDLDYLIKYRHTTLPYVPGWNGDPWGDEASRRWQGPLRPPKGG